MNTVLKAGLRDTAVRLSVLTLVFTMKTIGYPSGADTGHIPQGQSQPCQQVRSSQWSEAATLLWKDLGPQESVGQRKQTLKRKVHQALCRPENAGGIQIVHV